MLKPAILYKHALLACWAKASMDYDNRFFSENYWNFEINISDNNWDNHQFVSVDNSDNIVGFLAVTIDRPCHFVHSLGAIRFEKDQQYDVLFAKDFKHFFELLFGYYKYNKICFTVCIGSPHEKMYDRFSRKYGGRIVGVKERNFKLMDGTICDQKLYELSREEFVKHVKERDDSSRSKNPTFTPRCCNSNIQTR